jgi:hypothetical protein
LIDSPRSLDNKEVLIGDALTDELGTVPIELGAGLWRFVDGEPVVVRRSAPAERLPMIPSGLNAYQTVSYRMILYSCM